MRIKNKLIAPDDYWALTAEEKNKICNGVGAKDDWKTRFIPKTIYGLDMTEVANIHDYMYFLGGTDEKKRKADDIFLENMHRLINAGSWWLRFVRKRRAYKYYLCVAYLGDDAFYKNKGGK